MLSINIFFFFVPLLSTVLVFVNFIFAPNLPYKAKKIPFECGYVSFLLQNRTQFTIVFFIFGLLFLLFDLEIVLIYPFTVSSTANMIYGLIMLVIFVILVTIGFVYELGKDTLKIESRQNTPFNLNNEENDKPLNTKNLV